MRTSTIISSSLLAFAVSAAPIDLPKGPVEVPSLGLPPHPAVEIPTEFPATIPSELPTNDVTLPVENLPVKRADVPIVGDVLKDVTLIDGVDPAVHLPLPINTLPVNTLPVNTGLLKKAVDIDVPITVSDNDIVDELHVPAGAVPAVAVPAIPAVPVAGLASRDIEQSLPVVGGAKVPLNAGDIQVGTVDKYANDLVEGIQIENLPKVARDIEQTLPVVGGAKVPVNVGDIQVGTVDKYADELVKGIQVENLPKVARGIEQTLPVVGEVNVPLNVGDIQVGTVDEDLIKVVDGVALNNAPVLDVVKGTTVKDLPNLGRRDIEQTLPVAGNVAVPLNAGEIKVGTIDKDVLDVVEGTTTGL